MQNEFYLWDLNATVIYIQHIITKIEIINSVWNYLIPGIFTKFLKIGPRWLQTMHFYMTRKNCHPKTMWIFYPHFDTLLQWDQSISEVASKNLYPYKPALFYDLTRDSIANNFAFKRQCTEIFFSKKIMKCKQVKIKKYDIRKTPGFLWYPKIFSNLYHLSEHFFIPFIWLAKKHIQVQLHKSFNIIVPSSCQVVRL